MHHNRRIGSLNVVGLRRAGLREHVDPLRAAFKIYFEGGHISKVAIAKIEAEAASDPLVMEFIEFIKITKRGITKGGRAIGDED